MKYVLLYNSMFYLVPSEDGLGLVPEMYQGDLCDMVHRLKKRMGQNWSGPWIDNFKAHVAPGQMMIVAFSRQTAHRIVDVYLRQWMILSEPPASH